MISEKEILKCLNLQDKRISKLEALVEVDSDGSADKLVDDYNIDDLPEPGEGDSTIDESYVDDSFKMPSLSFNQVITFLGMTGIIIGVISFFFYAVANNWIGETMQVMLGVLVGFVLFGSAYILRDKKEQWSNIVFGGSYFIEYLAIGVGVLEYKVLPEFIGVFLCLIFLSSSLLLSLKFDSRVIAYFSLTGGYLIPFITGTYVNDLFVMGLYIFLSCGLVILSFKKNWFDVRFVSYGIMSVFLLGSTYKFASAESKVVPIIFLGLIYVLYNISSLVSSLKNEGGADGTISALDSIILASQPVLFLSMMYYIFNWTVEFFGIFVMLFSFVYLGEIAYFKLNNKNNSKNQISDSISYSLLSTAFISINLGLVFLLNSLNDDFLMILFAVEWILFSLLSINSVKSMFYKLYSYIFLFLVFIWYLFVLNFNSGLAHASVFILVLAGIVGAFYYLFNRDIDFKLNAAGFIIGGFALIFSFSKYLVFFGIKGALGQIVLSILWLIYTLFMFSNVHTKAGKWFVGSLLGFTLLKIAFNDLFYLDGAFRIVGFILFGVLLLIGGYFIKNETN
jgi:hypothetical protein